MPLPRVCQFFLRGRCQRGEKCDFSHVMPTNASSATSTTANGSSNKIVQSNNSSSMKTASPFAGEKEPFIAPKVSTLVDVYYCSELKLYQNTHEQQNFYHNLFEFKVPLPDHKGNPDSDDESIMRKVLWNNK